MNEILRRAIFSAGLDEVDVAARLEVDPKTVRRWLEGRLPYARHRWALADILKLNEADLWPELRSGSSRPDDIIAVYPHRSSIPRAAWRNLFVSAEHEISILDHSSLFLAQDADITRIFSEKARGGIRVRIALADPDALPAMECNGSEATRDKLITRIRNALALYHELCQVDGVEIRLHRVALYNSIYRADDEMLSNQHAYGILAANCPVLHLKRRTETGLACTHLRSFERIWSTTSSQI